jgi:hypothetical protein
MCNHLVKFFFQKWLTKQKRGTGAANASQADPYSDEHDPFVAVNMRLLCGIVKDEYDLKAKAG